MIAAKAAAERPLHSTGSPGELGEIPSSAGLTPLRSAVLCAIRAARAPLGAYALIEQLEVSLGRRVAPPTVYRSLDYLCRKGLVARLESRNAFLARIDPGAPLGDAFFICGRCGAAEEVGSPGVSGLLSHSAGSLGFRIERSVIELEGTCARCLAATDDAKALITREESTS
ncbi:MAG TPA: transcriptional repressor [Roseomonas sp.]|nr:transcriptional repressor [Roseomonas sp.]